MNISKPNYRILFSVTGDNSTYQNTPWSAIRHVIQLCNYPELLLLTKKPAITSFFWIKILVGRNKRNFVCTPVFKAVSIQNFSMDPIQVFNAFIDSLADAAQKPTITHLESQVDCWEKCSFHKKFWVCSKSWGSVPAGVRFHGFKRW